MSTKKLSKTLNFKIDPSLKKNKFVVVGTSHVREDHANSALTSKDHMSNVAPKFLDNIIKSSNKKINKFDYYVDFATEQRWPEALSKKLGYINHFNRGVSGLGISTYASRVLGIVDDIKPNFILLEIPCSGRYDIAFQSPSYKHRDAYSDKHWENNDHFLNYLYHYSYGDTGMDPKEFEKFHRLDLVKQNQLSSKLIKEMTKLNMYKSEKYETDLIFTQVIMISSYLKNNNIDHAWFNFDFANDPIGIEHEERNKSEFDKSLFRRYNIKCVNEMIGYEPLIQHVVKNYEPDPEVGFLADGIHLNSKYWLALINDVFVPYFQKHKL